MENCRRLLQEAMDDALVEAKGDCEEALRSLVLENMLLRLSLARIQDRAADAPGSDAEVDWHM